MAVVTMMEVVVLAVVEENDGDGGNYVGDRCGEVGTGDGGGGRGVGALKAIIVNCYNCLLNTM